MRYAIQNTCGQWWTGRCWGASQAREEYRADELPAEISDLEIADAEVDPSDVVYCDVEDGTLVASVVPVREAGDPLPWEVE